VVESLAQQIRTCTPGIHLGLVVGGGNVIRGTAASAEGLDRVSADYMGMLRRSSRPRAQDILERIGVQTGPHRHPDGVLAGPIRRRAVRTWKKVGW
jgi:uridylate kinase